MKTIIVLLCILLASVPYQVHAQTEAIGTSLDSSNTVKEKDNSVMFFAGFGTGNDPFVFSAVCGCVYIYKHVAATIRYVHQDPLINIFINEDVWDYGLLFGPVLKGKNLIFSISAGVSKMGYYKEDFYIWFDNYPPPENTEHTYTSIGFPLGAQFSWTPFKYFGTGLYSYADLNEVKSFYGIAFLLSFKF